ncbi:DUF4258 domain-containing protein [Desulfitobacterium chlororespirans]|uniref:DUF4258 domain-containing protein n=1 Tax=Desulfitobacterium chlororespirans DSM 11544 TaxID=1121395 RepID=A0A1M7UU25_9FIRM|nr:DUF4258 domain-containing protein [Desulfitobacterium chlororespirans]SHN86541.1 protein of unknown function [Desulfitobacterium chlororespirans DSM 11544]
MCDLGIEGRCQNPVECEKRRLIFKAQNEKMLELFGHTEFELFKRAFKEKGFDSLKKDPKRTHSADRAYERAISEAEIRSVFKNGDIVEYYQGNGIKKMLLWGFHYLGRKKYRPIHVVLKKEMTESMWEIATVYDPRSQPWLWNKEIYSERICFCKKRFL